MTARRETLQALIQEVRHAGGTLKLRDGRATVAGEVPADLLIRVHRHRRRLSQLLA